MAKIMLIRDFGPSNIPYPSQALGVIGTMLFNKSHDVRILDNNSNYKRYSTEQIFKEIADFSPDVLGFNVNTFNARKTYQLIKLAKQAWPHIPVLSGGIHMKYCHQEAAENLADVVVVNEADCIIHDLVDAVLQYDGSKASLVRNVKSIQGISYFDEDGTYQVGPQEAQPVLMEMDSIPFINYDLFNLQDFIKIKNDRIYLGFLVSQRGCPYPCNFCSETYLIGNIRENSSDYIIDYIKYLKRQYEVSIIGFGDNNFTLSKKRTTEVCNRIVRENLHKEFSFYCQTNVKTNVTPDQAKMLKKAGFEYVSLGIERLTEDGKKLVNKYIPDDKIQESIKTLRDSNINVNSNMLIGFPWDTKELVEEEKRLFDQVSPFLSQVQSHILVPMPGTEYYDDYPAVKQWYLDDSFFKAYDTYFSQVLSLYLGPDMLDLNPYNLSKGTVKIIKKTYYSSLIKTYMKRTHNFEKRGLFMVMQVFDLVLAGLSYLAYKVDSKLEAAMFTKMKQFRFLLGTKFAVRKIVEANWENDGEPMHELESSKEKATIGSDFH